MICLFIIVFDYYNNKMGNGGSGNRGGNGDGNSRAVVRVVKEVMRPTDTHCAPGEPCWQGKYCRPDYGYNEKTKTCNPRPSTNSRPNNSRRY